MEAPATEEALLRRAVALTGRSVAEVAELAGVEVAPDLRSHKGWLGQLVEHVLGASAGTAREPDFPALGVELKTIPVDAEGRPRESTWVCAAPRDGTLPRTWEGSFVRGRLERVLWVPVVTATGVPLGDRVFARPFLWSPDAATRAILRDDWEGLRELLALGEVDHQAARLGQALQLRPKARRSSSWQWVVDADGDWVRDTPRGFYLRARFTRQILAQHFRLHD